MAASAKGQAALYLPQFSPARRHVRRHRLQGRAFLLDGIRRRRLLPYERSLVGRKAAFLLAAPGGSVAVDVPLALDRFPRPRHAPYRRRDRRSSADITKKRPLGHTP